MNSSITENIQTLWNEMHPETDSKTKKGEMMKRQHEKSRFMFI